MLARESGHLRLRNGGARVRLAREEMGNRDVDEEREVGAEERRTESLAMVLQR